ncbi:hypothetical protein [Mucisphaera calidilacus]|uniref:Transporter n=1 Tax=Mucisphaera calidilacus TaxID=2527982 RepID=A0A518BTI7_9BACT|nr:hypothetical protein [Mucisphaera calidilacus]QDU70290.1 hypothetical protein Pan265_01130 [Mucisphaera calidilacus]
MRLVALPLLLATFLPLAAPAVATAQEAIRMPAATQPGRDRVVVRERVFWHSLDDGIDLLHSDTEVAYGLTRDFAVNLSIPVVFEFDEHGDNDQGIGDLHIMGKYRFYLANPGPVDTFRASALFGVDIPSWDPDMSSRSFNPMVGAVVTRITGRHGINAAARYKVKFDGVPEPLLAGEGEADTLWADASYLYRLSPDQYSAETTSSAYAVVETGLIYETNGDAQWVISPGFLYEAQTWALGVNVTLPAWQQLDHRPDLDLGLAIDLRFLF